jgi:uncharacterized protein YkwD
MRRARWYVSMVLLLVSLASCGPVSQNQQRARVSIATPTPTTTASNSSASLNVPAQPVPTRTATPTPRPSNNHAVPAQTGGSAGSGSQLEQQLFHLINQDRAAQGLYPYTLNSTLSNGARQHSQTMADGCGLQHQCPGEPDPCQRVTDEGVSWTSCGENIGYSSPDPTAWGGVQAIDQDMLDEQPPNDGHRQNLLSSSFHRVGIGIVIDSRGIVWVTEDFAS